MKNIFAFFKKQGLFIIVCSIISIASSGCVKKLKSAWAVDQKIQLMHSPAVAQKTFETPPSEVFLQVRDERPYVKNKSKKPYYVGHFRGGYGNILDSSTEGKISLADRFKEDIQKELLSTGFKVSELNGRRQLSVDILDYNFDTNSFSGNAWNWYEINVKVLDTNGKILAENVIKDKQLIKGSSLWGPVDAVKRDMPKIYSKIVTDIVQNDVILQALSK